MNIPGDQKAIWSSPFHIRATDSVWLLPLGGVTAGLIASDAHSMTRARSNADAIALGKNVSDITLAGMASRAGIDVRLGRPSRLSSRA